MMSGNSLVDNSGKNSPADRVIVSVIIPTYHDWRRLAACISALEGQSYRKDDFEVIIVNNDPSDKPEGLELPTNFRLLSESKPGSYAARNFGIQHANGAILAFTDSDCIPDPDWLSNAVHEFDNGAERLAGAVELFYHSSQLTWAEIYEKAFAFDQRKHAKRGGAVTANMFTRKVHFDRVGDFNESLLSGGDNEWGWRAQDKGISIKFAENVIVKHPARMRVNSLFRKARRVAAGLIAINDPKAHQSTLSLIFRGLVPPVRDVINTFGNEKLTFKEKLIASVMAYALKVYSTLYMLGLRSRIFSPQRA